VITKELILQEIQQALLKVKLQKEISIVCNVNQWVVNLHEELIDAFELIEEVISEKELSANYLNQFSNDIKKTLQFFPYINFTLEGIHESSKIAVKDTIDNQGISLEKQVKLLKFNLDFFSKLNFFNDNIVAIGANGSGKTTLSGNLKKYLPNTGVVISAQKILVIPTFGGVSNFANTSQKLLSTQTADKSLKGTYSTENGGSSWNAIHHIGGEFQILLDNLLAERSVIRNEFFNTLKSGQIVEDVPVTKLDKALKIWNSLIQHRVLECKDGINITVKTVTNGDNYPAYQMSDGEKVLLYLIAHVLQAPVSGFIISDEPEMYLHKSILNKLWDTLEQERLDCIFVYLTHDLDFAARRITAKKVWIKSFTHPDTWEIENIPNNDMPESLLMELLGSRKAILFCEGRKGSIDEKVYNLLFPNFTITPVDSCFSVMNYTKAFNKLPNVTVKAIGIIDSDYHDAQRLIALEDENIFSFSMAEPENLFFDESFLKTMANQLMFDDAIVNQIMLDCFSLLKKETELQVANYVSAKINYYFKDSHVSKGNTLANLNQNYSNFTNEIHIQKWYDERLEEINEVINNQNYSKLLAIFNNKGLKAVGNKNLKITDFTDKAIKNLQFNKNTPEMLRAYFPKKLIDIYSPK
jgi:energy-coupling factor transporter ATP-binding protein EcfA2